MAAYQPPYARGANGQLQATGLQGQPQFGQGFGAQAPLVQGQSGPMVDAYMSTLGRAPDQAGLDYYRSQMASGISPDVLRAQMAASPEAQKRNAANAIPTGLSGSEQALQGGLQGQLGAISQYGQAGLQALSGAQDQSNQLLGQARGDVNQRFDQGVAGLQPWQQGGQQAFDLQGAYSGAQGQAAQQAAYDNFTSSPGQQWLQEQGNRQVLSGAAATGGLGGGEVQRDLNRFGQGLAQQDFGNQYNRLAGLSGQGLQASNSIGQLRGQQGNTLGSLGQFGAGQAFNFGQAGNTALTNMGSNISNAIGNTANNLSMGRTNFGNAAAGDLGTSGSALANLQSAGGAGASDILGNAGANAASNAINFGNMSAQDRQALSSMLANLSTNQASGFAGQASPAQFLSSPGLLAGLGQAAGGVGGAMSGYAAI